MSDKVTVKLADQRTGNFVFSNYMTEEEARARLYANTKKNEENLKLKWAALHLRSLVMQLPKSRTPQSATVQNLKDCSPQIPEQLQVFFQFLLGGTSEQNNKEVLDRKVNALASDVIFNVSRATVKPWKHIAIGLGFSSLTGSKLAIQILNRMGHCISYIDAKGLETEFAYSVQVKGSDTPDEIQIKPNLATASVWDNYDANVETLDSKETLHATVGHTYQNILQCGNFQSTSVINFREARNRRSFEGYQRIIQPYRKALNRAQFIPSPTSTSLDTNHYSPLLTSLDFLWFWKLSESSVPLHAGFMSNYIRDPLPMQKICYMDPIPKSPTSNDVVRETMIRTPNVAKETGQDYAVVTYDLAIALKAYSIQSLDAPLFDKLLIMLGNFHTELAFYGAVGTYINDSGIEFILSECDVLAEGSMMGFIKGKFYNRCSRIHDLLAIALEKKLYNRFLADISEEENHAIHSLMSSVPSDPSSAEE